MKDEKVPTVGEARRRLSTSRVVPQLSNGVTTGASPNGRATRSRKA
jgi:fatty acid elongase 3